MTIEITPEIVNRLKKEGFYPDDMFSLLFVLNALKDNEIELLDAYDDFSTSKRAILTYQTLYRKGFLNKAKEGSPIFYELTEAGNNFLKELQPVGELESWIASWIALYPKANQNGTLHGNELDVLSKMKGFIKKYKYSKEVIIAATKSYLMQESAKNFMYTKRNIYFIDKRGEGSLLAAWCKNVIDNKVEGKLLDGSRTKLIQTVN